MNKQFYFKQDGVPTFYLDWGPNAKTITFCKVDEHGANEVSVSSPKIAGKLYDVATDTGYSYSLPEDVKKEFKIGIREGIAESEKISAIAQENIEDTWKSEDVTNTKIKKLISRCKKKGIITE